MSNTSVREVTLCWRGEHITAGKNTVLGLQERRGILTKLREARRPKGGCLFVCIVLLSYVFVEDRVSSVAHTGLELQNLRFQASKS